jgi:hypothetical protein
VPTSRPLGSCSWTACEGDGVDSATAQTPFHQAGDALDVAVIDHARTVPRRHDTGKKKPRR